MIVLPNDPNGDGVEPKGELVLPALLLPKLNRGFTASSFFSVLNVAISSLVVFATLPNALDLPLSLLSPKLAIVSLVVAKGFDPPPPKGLAVEDGAKGSVDGFAPNDVDPNDEVDVDPNDEVEVDPNGFVDDKPSVAGAAEPFAAEPFAAEPSSASSLQSE